MIAAILQHSIIFDFAFHLAGYVFAVKMMEAFR